MNFLSACTLSVQNRGSSFTCFPQAVVVDGVNCSRQTHVITVTNEKLFNRGNYPIGPRDAQSTGTDARFSLHAG